MFENTRENFEREEFDAEEEVEELESEWNSDTPVYDSDYLGQDHTLAEKFNHYKWAINGIIIGLPSIVFQLCLLAFHYY